MTARRRVRTVLLDARMTGTSMQTHMAENPGDPDVLPDDIDACVITAARQGDRGALTSIIKAYDPRLRRLAFYLIRERDSVDDVLQEVYIRVLRNLPRFRARSSIGTWLYRITYNTCISYLGRQTNLTTSEDVSDCSKIGVDPAEAIAGAQTLVDLLRALPQDQLAAVLLVDAYDLGYRRAAEVLGVPVSTLASRAKVARAKLRAALTSSDSPFEGTRLQ